MLQDLLSSAAAKHPSKIAVADSLHSISYSELEVIAKELAANLLNFDIGSSSLVLIYAEKTIATIAAIYGVLHAGGAYVPLDPTAPLNRQCFIARDARSRFLIADELGAARALEIAKTSEIPVLILFDRKLRTTSKYGEWRIHYISSLREFQSSYPSSADEHTLPAYVLYTSGSTGRPKGVVLSHRNAECFVNWATDYFDLNETDVLASYAPLYFDMSIFDIFSAAKACATVCLIPKGISQFPTSLGKYINKKGITTWYSVPSALVDLIRSQEFVCGIRGTLRRILYAGEPFPIIHLRKLANALPNVSIFNLYGPTEANVITYYRIDSLRDLQSTSIPIGIPCPYAEILIVDGKQVVTEVGQVGELIVRGDSLMLEYFNMAEQTTKAIRPLELENPESPPYYHTGDLVEILEGGNYRFIARIDRLAKVNGYRVEMGEIENVAMELSAVEECVCLAHKAPLGKMTLVAFVVILDDSFGMDRIRDHLKNKLPGYMIPKLIIPLEALPRMATGKCDHNGLAVIAAERCNLGESSE